MFGNAQTTHLGQHYRKKDGACKKTARNTNLLLQCLDLNFLDENTFVWKMKTEHHWYENQTLVAPEYTGTNICDANWQLFSSHCTNFSRDNVALHTALPISDIQIFFYLPQTFLGLLH